MKINMQWAVAWFWLFASSAATWAEPGVTNSLGMRLAHLPAGKFEMGSPKTESGREEQENRHEVELTRGFYLGMHEVTIGQFREFIRDSGHATESEKDGNGSWGLTATGNFVQEARYNWASPGFKQTDDHPVVDVSWNDAKAFCQWLSKKEKRTYRLPTEAEWEYACRAGAGTSYSFGNAPEGISTSGNVADATARAEFTAWALGIKGKDGYPYTAPVGQFQPNRFGLYDMHGNVWEWCEDWFDEDAYAGTKPIDPTGPESGTKRVHRGGGWSSAPERCRSASRIGRHPSSYRGSYLGFRVVLELNPLSTIPPAGLRVLYNGNSWHNYVPLYFTEPLVKAAGIQGHKRLGNLSFEQSKPLLETGEVDAYSFGVHWWYGGHNRANVEKIVDVGLKHNPDFRFCWQAAWLVGDGVPETIKTKDDYDNTKIADLQAANDKARRELEGVVDELNKNYGTRAIFIVPVGDAVANLRALIVSGKFPGLTRQSELFNDAMPHPGGLMMALCGYCHFAAIYGISPEGLALPEDDIKAAQHKIMQQIAWETVSKYSHAGIDPLPDGKPNPR
jgi:sulfatase modifying factor 1